MHQSGGLGIPLTEQVGRAIRRVEEERAAGEEFARLRDFLTRMQHLGFAPRKPYDLPPLDTIGRTTFRNPTR